MQYYGIYNTEYYSTCGRDCMVVARMVFAHTLLTVISRCRTCGRTTRSARRTSTGGTMTGTIIIAFLPSANLEISLRLVRRVFFFRLRNDLVVPPSEHATYFLQWFGQGNIFLHIKRIYCLRYCQKDFNRIKVADRPLHIGEFLRFCGK